MREEILFNDDWMFCEGDLEESRPQSKAPMYTQAKTETKLTGPASYNYLNTNFFWPMTETRERRWEHVRLPHDYIIKQTPNEEYNTAHGYFKNTNAWYRKHFYVTPEDADRRITLYFEGVAINCTVYVNGCLLKHHYSAFSGFEIDITDYLFFEEKRTNVVAVYVTTDDFEGWWYQGGGIFRNVWLIKTDKVAIDRWGVYAKPVKVCEDNWKVDFETTVLNKEYEDVSLSLISEIVDKDGNTVATGEGGISVASRSLDTAKYTAEVGKVNLWDVDSPYLYTVNTKLCKNGEIIDTNSTRIGFRTFFCDKDKGFYLNGRHLKIKGVCGHGDYGITGIALPDTVAKYKIKLLKDMGCNAFRTSHYPHSIATLDALDELGFIVMDENRWFCENEETFERLTDLVKRDRNRPSVIFWSLGNEEKFYADPRGGKIGKALYDIVRKLDDSRYITDAVDRPINCSVYPHDDVVGINYNYDKFDTVRELYPDKPFLASECTAVQSTRGHYLPYDAALNRYPAYDTYGQPMIGREETWKFMCEREWVMGVYQWIGIDHRGECIWPTLSSHSGAVDMFLQKKDAFYQNKSLWSDKPMVHILPHWNFKGFENEIIDVHVYTNCDELELIHNGVSLGKKKIEKYSHGEWKVTYVPGELTAVGYINGAEKTRDTVKTSDRPAKLVLRLENEAKFNGEDVAVFTCFCVDKDGVEVPDAEPTVTFTSNNSGFVLGTGSDIADHNPPHIRTRKMYAGKISVAVRLNKTDKPLKLYAVNSELGTAVFTLNP